MKNVSTAMLLNWAAEEKYIGVQEDGDEEYEADAYARRLGCVWH